jgi:hypothetical protein
LLTKLFPKSPCADKINYEDIDTQRTLVNSGRPDIVVDHHKLYAHVEVKISSNRAPTDNQPEGYFEDLKDNAREERWLVFLVPKGWEFEKNVKMKLDELTKGSSVQANFVYWEDILDIIDENKLQELNPFFDDFYRLLKPEYKPDPIKFKKEELDIMFNKEIPEVLKKLDEIIKQIQAKGSREGYDLYPKHTGGRVICLEENGLYLDDNAGTPAFFFGEWTKVWEDEGSPLCFGVNEELLILKEIMGELKDTKPFGSWRVKTISKDILSSENVADQIWKEIEPTLKKVLNACPKKV